MLAKRGFCHILVDRLLRGEVAALQDEGDFLFDEFGFDCLPKVSAECYSAAVSNGEVWALATRLFVASLNQPLGISGLRLLHLHRGKKLQEPSQGIFGSPILYVGVVVA